MDMRGTPGIVMIGPRVSARSDRNEPVAPFSIGQRKATTREIRVQRSIVPVDLVQVSPGSIALPDFDERMAHRLSIFIDDSAAYDDALSQWLPGVLLRQIERFHIDALASEHRPGDFRKRLRDCDQRFRGRPLDRRNIGPRKKNRGGARGARRAKKNNTQL